MRKASPIAQAKTVTTEAAKVIETIAAEPASAPVQKPVAKAESKDKAVSKNSAKSSAAPAKVSPANPETKPVVRQTSKRASTIIQPAKLEKEAKAKKPESKKTKQIRDSFTFPETDYALFALLKHRALQAGREIKKSELLRAGLAALAAMSEENLIKALAGVESIKTGRPSK